MTRAEAWSVRASAFLVGGTGLVYGWMRYLVTSADPYAVVNHPLQPALQHLHLWLAPLLVFAACMIWRAHAWDNHRRGVRRRRRSGLLLMLTLAPMVVSGYLIQTAGGETWRRAWVLVHCTSALLWLAGQLAHELEGGLRRDQPGSAGGAGCREATTFEARRTASRRDAIAVR